MNYVSISTFAGGKTTNNTKKVDRSVPLKRFGHNPGVFFPAMFYVAVSFVIYVGWCFREYELITAERGTGYLLGITGTVLMLLLVIYPLRKRISVLAFLGSNRLWFRVHMFFGVLGPVLIIFHANFDSGSLNSRIALLSMIVVALSGFIGRYIYVRIHYGLSERKVSLAELRNELENEREEISISRLFADLPEVRKEIFDFTETILAPPASLVDSIGLIGTAGWKAQFIRWRMEKIIKVYLNNLDGGSDLSIKKKKAIRRQLRSSVRRLFTLALRVMKFSLYERLFALWHVLHIPLFILMVVAVVVHIIAVHLF